VKQVVELTLEGEALRVRTNAGLPAAIAMMRMAELQLLLNAGKSGATLPATGTPEGERAPTVVFGAGGLQVRRADQGA